MILVISSGPAHSDRLDNPLPVGVLQSSSWVASSSIRPPGTFANIGIWGTMGLIPSRGSAHDYPVDRRCPSKHQKTSVDMSLNAPLRPPFRRCLPRGQPPHPALQFFVYCRLSALFFILNVLRASQMNVFQRFLLSIARSALLLLRPSKPLQPLVLPPVLHSIKSMFGSVR
jgi:hypothetical protein